jgi:hypothetical protein
VDNFYGNNFRLDKAILKGTVKDISSKEKEMEEVTSVNGENTTIDFTKF